MIKMVKRVTASALWNIDGTEISLQYRKTVSDAETVSKILEYKRILQDRVYEEDNACLCDMFKFFGGVSFVKIGMIYSEDFLTCFSHYACLYAAEWADSDCCLFSKNVGYQHVFQVMLRPIKYNFQHILHEVPDSSKFSQLVDKAFEEHWTSLIELIMRDGKSLDTISRRIGDVRLSKYMMFIPEKTQEYISELANRYTRRRETISLRKLHNFIFGDDSRTNFPGGSNELFRTMESVVDSEAKIQFSKFVSENHVSMDVSIDRWVLYKHHGVTLRSLTLDFSQIKRESMKYEIKYFMKNRYSGSIKIPDGILNVLVNAANRICENNPSVNYFADIDVVDVKMLQLSMETAECTQSAITSAISACRLIIDYLSGFERDESIRTPKPHHNPFRDFTLVNSSCFSENTPYIPDCVMAELEKYSYELNETDHLVFRIFNETGMRAKEVVFLQDDCLSKARYDGYVLLKYVAYKALKARRRSGLSDYHSVYISTKLASMISKQIEESKKIREECGLPYIFLHQNEGYKISMLSITYFADKINNIIRKHNICDESGALWRFTSRQCRKTLITNMIEKGATVEELVYQLGHLDRSTALKYYAEVKSTKLADLNSEFFEKQFEVSISSNQLYHFTEEERRLLYVDFRLGYRRVELGFCVRKLCDGVCNNMKSMHHCVSCPNLCTGKRYLPFWQSLLDSEKGEMDRMLEIYKQENITAYSDFMEFKQKNILLSAYQNIVDRLNETEGSRL